MSEFYVVSVKHTNGNHIIWWCPDRRGYTRYLDRAGRYTEEEIERHSLNDGRHTKAIPCELADSMALRCVRNEYEDRLKLGLEVKTINEVE